MPKKDTTCIKLPVDKDSCPLLPEDKIVDEDDFTFTITNMTLTKEGWIIAVSYYDEYLHPFTSTYTEREIAHTFKRL